MWNGAPFGASELTFVETVFMSSHTFSQYRETLHQAASLHFSILTLIGTRIHAPAQPIAQAQRILEPMLLFAKLPVPFFDVGVSSLNLQRPQKLLNHCEYSYGEV